MALTPVTEEEFIQIAREEGIPLSGAVSMWESESSLGMNRDAFVHPSLKAGKQNGKNSKGEPTYWNAKADKIGWGSMQMTRPTYDGLVPGGDYDNATDADLVRAGMKLLKPAVKSDGTMDMQKAIRLYKGGGKDASFDGYSPSTDPVLLRRMNMVSDAINNAAQNPEASVREIASAAAAKARGMPAPKLNLPDETPLMEAQVQQKKSEAESLIEFDPVAAQAKFDEAKEMKAAQLTAILNNQLAGQTRALNLAEMNPYGAYGEAEATFEALKTANGRMRQTVSDAHFQTKPANEGVLGILETFARKIAADENLPQITKETNDLQTAANNYQVVLSNLMKNGAQGSIDFKDQIAIDTASRTAGNDALNIDLKAIGVDQRNAGISARNQAEANRQERAANTLLRQRDQDAYRADKDELTRTARSYEFAAKMAQNDRDFALKEAKYLSGEKTAESRRAFTHEKTKQVSTQIEYLEQKIANDDKRANSQAQLDALNADRITLDNLKKSKEMLGNFGTDNIDEISAAANTVLNNNTPNKKWTMREINGIFKSKEQKQQLFDVLGAGGDKAVLRNPNVGANILEMAATGSPAEKEAASKLAKDYKTEVDRLARAMPDNPMASDKAKEASAASRQQLATLYLAGKPTSEINFNANAINVKPLAAWIEIAGMEGGLADTLKAAKIDTTRLAGDAELVTKLLLAQQGGKLPVSPEQLLDQLDSYYKILASTRAKDEVIYKANIPVKDDAYVIETTNKKQFDLATRAGLLEYVDRVKASSKVASPSHSDTMRAAGQNIGNSLADLFR